MVASTKADDSSLSFDGVSLPRIVTVHWGSGDQTNGSELLEDGVSRL
jgi:hypothetical protein